MEVPSPAPTSAPQGRKPTHDFLSLYTTTNSNSQDTTAAVRPPPASFLTTQNFLQPLEVAAAAVSKEARSPFKADKPASITTPASSVEHILPGGIGTYTISHISYINDVPKPDVSLFKVAQAISNDTNKIEENSNTSSQTGSGFALWEQSAVAVNKATTGNKNNVGDRPRPIVRESARKLGQWSVERQSQSSFNQQGSFAPASSSQLPVGNNNNNNRSFMDLIVSTKSTREDLKDCEVDFVIKKEGSPSDREDFATRTEGKIAERKANTPRSKHSATEQRRRSKINDRFQMLRDIIPHSDQKRDKASFLFEAIEYIQYLQEKVHRYEGSFPGWNHESAKQMPTRNKCQPGQVFIDNCGSVHGGSGTTPILSVKMSHRDIGASSTISGVVNKQGDSEIINPVLVRPIASQPKIFVESSDKSHFPHKLVSDTDNCTSQHPQHGDVRECKIDCAVPNDESEDEEVAIEGGTINISNAYSQGFLNKLTQALHGLGVDLSQSRISVQIDLGKQKKIKLCCPETMKKGEDLNPTSQVKANSSLPCTSGYSDQPAKRLKTGNHL